MWILTLWNRVKNSENFAVSVDIFLCRIDSYPRNHPRSGLSEIYKLINAHVTIGERTAWTYIALICTLKHLNFITSFDHLRLKIRSRGPQAEYSSKCSSYGRMIFRKLSFCDKFRFFVAENKGCSILSF